MKKFQINSNVIYKIIDDEVHILDHRSATIHSLNETASFVWKQLSNPITKAMLVKKIRKEFDVLKNEAENDIEEFLNTYIEKEYIIKI